jgi:hypothetical protein
VGNRAEVALSLSGFAHFNGAGTNYLVQTPTGVLYCVHVDQQVDVMYRKSVDGGLTWSQAVLIFQGTVTALSVWYDRWSNIAAGLIHVAYSESATDDTLYRTIDTESSDALSTQTTIFAGTSTATNGNLSICRARGGNVYCYTMIDAGAEGGFFRLPNANVPNGAWDAARANPEALATGDMIILQPGWAADNQDMLAIFWDVSANEISRYVHDDSANTWAETLILAAVENAASNAFPHFAAAVDIANSRSLVTLWTAVDTFDADLAVSKVSEASIAGAATAVLDSTDDQGLCAVSIDALGHWHVFYAGKSDGSETWLTSVNIYTKVSTDSGSTWGAETLLTSIPRNYKWMATCPITYIGVPPIALFVDSVAGNADEITVNVHVPQRRAQHQVFVA